MNKKIVFLDIDGTLVCNHQDMSAKVKYALSEARKNGHYIFLCTGRNRLGIEDLMVQGLFDGAICSAGGYIEINGQKIYEDAMNADDVKYAREIFENNNILYNMESNFGCYQSEDFMRSFIVNFEDVKNSEVDRMIEEWQRNLNMYSLKTYDEHPASIQTIVYVTDDKDALHYVKDKLSDIFTFLIYSADTKVMNGELMKKGVNKGFGILKVLEYYNMDIRDTIGFGDSMNDYEMIQTCHYGVVMENGDERIKTIASTVCESVKDDGIYHELKRLGLF